MKVNYQLLTHPGIRTLVPYIPGKSIEEVTREPGIKEIIKLASNENPLGCSPHALSYLASCSPQLLACYPLPKIHPLRKKLAEHCGLEESQLILGNGSDGLFGLLLTIFALNLDKHALTHDYAFSTYAIQAQTLGIPMYSVPVHPDWSLDIDGLIKQCTKKTALIFLANPNNPTGLFTPLSQIEKLLTAIPETTILVLDEAYYEFAFPKRDPGALMLLKQFSNLVVTRTFSKAYGLAGLRLGYAMASEEIIELMDRVQLPFMVNQLAMQLGIVALEDEDFLDKTLQNNQQGLKQLREGFDRLGLAYSSSAGNFLTFHCRQNALPVYEQLLKKGIIVRPLHPYQLSEYLRVTVGTHEQNACFLDILPDCLNTQ